VICVGVGCGKEWKGGAAAGSRRAVDFSGFRRALHGEFEVYLYLGGYVVCRIRV